MRNINLFVSTFFVIECVKTVRHYYTLKKCGGNKIKSFRHKSELKILSLSILILSIIFTMWIFSAQRQYIMDGIVTILYSGISMINFWRKIEVFEDGIFFNGRFMKWCDVKLISECDRDGIRIDLKSSKLIIRVITKVENRAELLEQSRQFLKEV